MENTVTPWFLNGDKIYTAMKPDTKLQMIAVEDIGKYGARAFTNAEQLNGREIDLAGDEISMTDAAAALGAAMGKPIEFVQIPIASVRSHSADFAAMIEWFERVGYDADIAGLEREFGITPTRFVDWARRHAPRA
jgi:uncharacterized protein YbjT (DUF2867 family)